MPGWHSGPRYQVWKAEVRARWGTVCHLCGHEGAGDADLLVPLAVWPDQPYDPNGARPAHGVYSRCSICHMACNQSRGAKLLNANEPYKPQLSW